MAQSYYRVMPFSRRSDTLTCILWRPLKSVFMPSSINRVCWLSSARYSSPLDLTNAKKWRALAPLGDLYVIGFSHDGRAHEFSEGARFALLPSLPITMLRYALFFVRAPLMALGWVLRGEVDILIAQSPYEGISAALVKLAARLMGKRVALIIESHGDFEESFFLYRRIPLAGLVRGLLRLLSEFALRHADVLRAVSSTTHAQLRRRVPHTPIEQFMAWTDVDVFRTTPRVTPLADSAVFVFAGTLAPIKGVHVLIEAFAAVPVGTPHARLRLIGKASNADYVAQLEAQITRLGLAGSITFVGVLDQTALAREMAGARALVLPSFSEGLPRVLVEALACGTPVISTRVGGIADIVQPDVNGWLIAPNDVPALTEAMRQALSTADIEAWGVRARTSAALLFSVEAYVEGHQRLFAHAQEALARE
jgi:glycosyltransferase involved in cell wall biosynthesis